MRRGYVTSDARRIAAKSDSKIDLLEYELTGVRQLARRLWAALKARTGAELEDLFNIDVIEMLDPTYQAADIIYRNHKIIIEPCRRVRDNGVDVYLAHYPNGETKNIHRDQLLMMAGMGE